ncbi:MAG: hypothetical protein COA42_17870 [Alteromonadaceae bacterium]|nr:MAG: hypothetical protein COA42_17870 [Alteromonadaceae bacterium]
MINGDIRIGARREYEPLEGFNPKTQQAATIEYCDGKYRLAREVGLSDEKRRLRSLIDNPDVDTLHARCIYSDSERQSHNVTLTKRGSNWCVTVDDSIELVSIS